MRKYKVLTGALGQWRKGDVITDDDLKAVPQFGGVDALKGIDAIEDHYDLPPRQPAPATVQTTRASGDPADQAPEVTTGDDRPNVVKGRSGKSSSSH